MWRSNVWLICRPVVFKLHDTGDVEILIYGDSNAQSIHGDSNVWRFYLVIWRFQCMEILLSNMEIPMYGDSTW
jgi:hypothetical protein